LADVSTGVVPPWSGDQLAMSTCWPSNIFGVAQPKEVQLRDAAHNAKAEELERRIQDLEAQLGAEKTKYVTRLDLKAEHDLREAIQAAEDEGGDARLGDALQLIDTPGAARAFDALTAITAVAKACDMEALAKVKAAERAARDVVVWRCHSVASPGGRSAFLETAEKAFGKPLGCDLRAQLLNSYHKIAKDKPESFISNAKLETARRGRPRPRRQRGVACDAQDATLGVLPTMPDDSEAEAAAQASDSDLAAATEALPELEAAMRALPASSSQDQVAGTEPGWKQEPAYVKVEDPINDNASNTTTYWDEWVWAAHIEPVDFYYFYCAAMFYSYYSAAWM